MDRRSQPLTRDEYAEILTSLLPSPVIAAQIGCSRQQVWRIRNGKTLPPGERFAERPYDDSLSCMHG
jgi:hypothetical protein